MMFRVLAVICALGSAPISRADEGVALIQATWPSEVGSFVSDDEEVCFEGGNRTIESALGLRKAGPRGPKYALSKVLDQTCEIRGYSNCVNEADDCHLGVRVCTRPSAADGPVKTARRVDLAAVVQWSEEQHVDTNESLIMDGCTCQIGSPLRKKQDSQCRRINHQYTGAWVHHDPETGKDLMCDEGPFQFATLALAVLKTTAQLPMHPRDHISLQGCKDLGFAYKFPPVDHCFSYMHIWTRTPDLSTDLGIKASSSVEGNLFHGGFHSKTIVEGNMNPLLESYPGCHCAPNSEVGRSMQGVCQGERSWSPIRDWWKK